MDNDLTIVASRGEQVAFSIHAVHSSSMRLGPSFEVPSVPGDDVAGVTAGEDSVATNSLAEDRLCGRSAPSSAFLALDGAVSK